MVDSNAIAGFLPSVHGLHFANRYPPGPTLKLGAIDPRWVGVGDAAAGLCGGMSWFVREWFEEGRTMPPDTTAPENGSPLFKARCARGLDLGPQGCRQGHVAGSFLHLIDRAAGRPNLPRSARTS